MALVQAARITLEQAPIGSSDGIEVEFISVAAKHSESSFNASNSAQVSSDDINREKIEQAETQKAQPLLTKLLSSNTISKKNIATNDQPRKQARNQQRLANRSDSSENSSTQQAIGSNSQLSNSSGLNVQQAAISSGRGMLGGTGLRAVRTPKPPYPYAAKRVGFEGSVRLDLLINQEGHVQEAKIVKSSGRQDCDDSAKNTILRHWRFEPARALGQQIAWNEAVLVRYELR